MKKLIISIVIALFTMNAMADRINWQLHLTLDNAIIHYADGDKELGSCLNNINAAKIALATSFMHPVYSGETINDPPYIDYEFDDQFLAPNGPISFVFEANNPLTSDESLFSVVVQLGWTDENTYEFTPVAYSDAVSLSYLNSRNMLHPATAGAVMWTNEWRPKDFYTSVPEPSTTILALFGIGMFLKRRK